MLSLRIHASSKRRDYYFLWLKSPFPDANFSALYLSRLPLQLLIKKTFTFSQGVRDLKVCFRREREQGRDLRIHLARSMLRLRPGNLENLLHFSEPKSPTL